MTHTKGPWTCKAADYTGLSAGIVRDEANDPIADCRYTEVPSRDLKTPEQIDANARLIASAPALYAALNAMLDAYAARRLETVAQNGYEALHSAVRQALAALAAADGEEQP